jgi:hypothetical protein
MLCVVAILSFHATPCAAQPALVSLHLSVTDSLRRPIERAIVFINGRQQRGATDALGKLTASASVQDSLNVVVRAIGYHPSTLRLPAGWNSSGTFPVVLIGVVTVLPEIAVSGRNGLPEKYRGISRMQSFYDRRARGRGYFITRDMLDQTLVPDVEGILAQLPIRGVRSNLSFVRCSGRGDKVNVYVNGARVQVRDPREALSTIHPLNIEAIEVYRNISEIPPEFLDDNCAAIVIWTRVN